MINKFTVKRSTWIRGRPSQLLMKTGDMCCLGFYMEACGVPCEEMLHVNYPGNLLSHRSTLPAWVTKCSNIQEIVHINDTSVHSVIQSILNDEEREAKLKELFAEHSVEIVFED